MFLPGEIRHGISDEPTIEDNTTLAKCVAMVVLFISSMCFGSVPIKLNKWLKWNTSSKNNKHVKLLLCAGGGVLLCTTFIHLLPEVNESIEELNFDIGMELPYGELLMCLGFFLMFFVEEAVHLYLHRQENKRCKELNAIRNSLSMRVNEEYPNIDHHADHSHQDKHANHSHFAFDDSGLNTIRGLLVVLALSVHELFEGFAIGLESSSRSVWYMFGAVSAHKLVIAFCIGVELVSSKMKTGLIIIYIFVFAVVSPLGIGIGTIITSGDEDDTTIVSVILQGLATGTLLYVVFFEILKSDNKGGLKHYFAVLVGFLVMFSFTLLENL